MLVPLAGRILQIHEDSTPGTVMETTVGAMQNTNAAAREDTVFLHLEERNRVKLTEARTQRNPAAAKTP